MREIVRRQVIKTGRLSQHLGVGPTAVSPKQSLSRLPLPHSREERETLAFQTRHFLPLPTPALGNRQQGEP